MDVVEAKKAKRKSNKAKESKYEGTGEAQYTIAESISSMLHGGMLPKRASGAAMETDEPMEPEERKERKEKKKERKEKKEERKEKKDSKSKSTKKKRKHEVMSFDTDDAVASSQGHISKHKHKKRRHKHKSSSLE